MLSMLAEANIYLFIENLILVEQIYMTS